VAEGSVEVAMFGGIAAKDNGGVHGVGQGPPFFAWVSARIDTYVRKIQV
jgi:hypothetical protein